MTKLPKVLRVGRQTCVRVLNDLAREGLIIQRRGSGSYVAETRQPPLIPARSLRLGIVWPYSVTAESLREGLVADATRGVLEAWGISCVKPDPTVPQSVGSTRCIWTSVDRSLVVEGIGEAEKSYTRTPALNDVVHRQFDGLVTLSITDRDWLDRLLREETPVVVADFPNEECDWPSDEVFFDPMPAITCAVRYFSARGLSRIHFLGQWMRSPAPNTGMSSEEWKVYGKRNLVLEPDTPLRRTAHRHAMERCGLEMKEDWVHYSLIDEEYVVEAAERLLALPEPRRPQAVVCHAIDQADILMKVFAQRGVPLEAVGCSSHLHSGPAHKIRADARDLGATAGELLVWRLKQPKRLHMRVGMAMRFVPGKETVETDATDRVRSKQNDE